MVRGLRKRLPRARLSVFDHGRGAREFRFGSGVDAVSCECVGAKLTRRLYLPESYFRVRMAARIGGGWNIAARRLLAADAILDISGGDSFTDLYGLQRFRSVSILKRLAIRKGKRLILLPQTYGPFNSAKARQIASEIVEHSVLAWVRDERSYDVLRSLLGDSFDRQRHRSGVDVAFALPSINPGEQLDEGTQSWINNSSGSRVGLNVSGLLWHSPKNTRDQYGFKADYREVITGLARRLVAQSGTRLLLIPHVLTVPGHFESDSDACSAVRDALPSDACSSVQIVEPRYEASEMKWIISHCDWFCGTRMHSTIAGLSSGVATAAIAYSPKTLGVFETCGMGDHVADPTVQSTQDVLDKLWASYESRGDARNVLAAQLPVVLRRVEEQMDQLAAACEGRSAIECNSNATPTVPGQHPAMVGTERES